MRNFYLFYPIFQTASGKLSWSHYCELLSISDEHKRSFYEKETINDDILCADKDSIQAEYALGNLPNTIFASKYTLYIPDKEELEMQVEKVIKNYKTGEAAVKQNKL